MHHTVIVETREMEDSTFRAYVVDGPEGMQGLRGEADSHVTALSAAKVALRTAYVGDTFDFIHSEV